VSLTVVDVVISSYVFENNIEGTIPTELGRMTAMRIL
jgi:hypothetical protein